MPNYAIIDIGTNSQKLFIYNRENGMNQTIVDTIKITRLGRGLQKTGLISAEAMDKNISALQKSIDLAKKYNAQDITAVGTMCLRSAKNSDLFLDRAKDVLGLDIKVISGLEEARLSYLPITGIDNLSKQVVFDTGGGSTEIVFGSNPQDRISINCGAIQPTERFLHSDPVKQKELDKMFITLKKEFKEVTGKYRVSSIIGIGGTATTLGAIKIGLNEFVPELVDGTKLSLEDVDQQVALFVSKTNSERKRIIGLAPERSDLILGGTAVIKTILDIFGLTYFTISTKGLRHGIMLDRWEKEIERN